MKKTEKKIISLEKKLSKLKKRSQLPTIKTLKKKLWALTSEIVRNSSHVCFTCDRILAYPNRQAGHHFSKGGHQAVMFDFENLRVQGSECNLFRSGHQVEFAYRLRKELGDSRYEDLYRRANTPHKWAREVLEQLIEERKQYLERLLV